MLNRSWHEFSACEMADSRPVADERRGAAGLIAALLLSLISFYRQWVSPMLAPSCRFHPTCSSYAIESIRRYGPLGGTVRAIARVARCHPLSSGGYDPVR